ncbi:Mitochondrial protein import protein MAS5 [Diplonema papillatum]|nr:Mitochondrial protein import protein MAS5 [Diplonema papillatum]
MFHPMGGGPMGGGPGGGYPRYARPQAVAAPLSITLEELYKGVEKELDLDALVDDKVKEMGVTGKLEVKVLPGMREGTRIPFKGRGLLMPGMKQEEKGDLTVILEVEDHERFKVDGDDLLAEMTITLPEALTGFSKEFVHLDGTKLLINSDKVVAPKSTHVVEKKGLPISDPESGDITGYGDLCLTFTVDFPRVLESDQIEKVQQLLPTRVMEPRPDLKSDVQEYEMADYDPEEWMQTQAKQDDESDDEDLHGGPQVACAHQ